jgi:hypothetical protein
VVYIKNGKGNGGKNRGKIYENIERCGRDTGEMQK